MNKEDFIGIAKPAMFFSIMLLAVIVFSAIVSSANYTIDGDRVYFDDSKVFLNVQPHTLQGSGWVYINLTSKVYTGGVNAILGTEWPDMRVTQVERYNPHEVTKSYTCTESLNYTTNPKYFWCYQNLTGNQSNTTIILFEHSYTSANLSTKTAYWQETEQYQTINPDITTFNYEFDGKNKWFVWPNISINQGQNYQIRLWIEMPRTPIFEQPKTYKYDFGIYPSAYALSIAGLQAAHQNNQFYFIDPWTRGTTGLTSYWPFTNYALNGYYNLTNMTDSGSQNITGGIIDQAKGFTSSASNYLSHATPSYNGGNLRTYNFWLKSTNMGDAFAGIWNTRAGAGFSGFIKYSANQMQFSITNATAAAPGNGCYGNGGMNITDGSWHMITGIYNGTTGTMYIDTTYVCNFTFVSSVVSESTWRPASDPCCGSRFYNGSLDEMAMWNTTLNSSDMEYLYNLGSPGILQQPPFFTDFPITINNVSVGFNDSIVIITSKLNNITANITGATTANYSIIYPNGTIQSSANLTNQSESGITKQNVIWLSNATLNITTNQVGTWIVNVTAYNGSATSYNQSIFIVYGSAPTMNTCEILPAAPVYVNTTILQGWANATDVNGDNLSYYYEWYLNNVTNTSGYLSTQFNASTKNNINNLSRTFVKHQNWTFACMANDGTYNSTWLNSTTLEISNSPPYIESMLNFNFAPFVNIEKNITQIPHNTSYPYVGVYCNDSNNDTLNYSINDTTWKVWNSSTEWDYVPQRDDYGGTFNLTGLNVTWTGFYNYTFNCSDDETSIQTWFAFNITNSIPVTGTPTISPSTNIYKNTTPLTCTNSTTTDADGDSVTLYYQWFNDTGTITGANTNTLTNASYNRYDNITCQIIPNDGEINGTSKNSSIVSILNTRPMQNSCLLNYSDVFVYRNTTIQLWSNITDYDNDLLRYRWITQYVNGTYIESSASAFTYIGGLRNIRNYTAAEIGVIKGSSIYDSCYGDDGNATTCNSTGCSNILIAYKLSSNILSITNTQPILIAATANSSTNDTTTALNLYCQGSDIDPGDTQKHYWFLYRNGAAYSTITSTAANYSNGTIVNVGNISGLGYGNYTLSCMATDGTANSSWANSTALYLSSYFNSTNQNETSAFETTGNHLFNLTIFNDGGNVSANFTINGTTYTPTKVQNGNWFNFTANVTHPLVEVNNTNHTWLWQINYTSNGSVTSYQNITGNTTIYQDIIPTLFNISSTLYVETQPIPFSATLQNPYGKATLLLILQKNTTNTSYNLAAADTTYSSTLTQGQNTGNTEWYNYNAYLNVTFNGTTYTRNYSQQPNATTYKIVLDACGTITNTTGLNFSFIDSLTYVPINVTSGSGLAITANYPGSSSTRTYTFSIVNVTSYRVCMYPQWATLNMNFNFLGKATGYNDKYLSESNQAFNNATPIMRTLGFDSTGNYSNVKIHVLNYDDVPYVGYTIYQYKWDSITLNYTLISSLASDFTGTAVFSVTTTDYYKFNVTNTSGSGVYSTGNFKIAYTDYYLRIQDTFIDDLEIQDDITSLLHNMTANVTTATCTFGFYDGVNVSSQFCLKVVDGTNYTSTELSFACTSNDSGSLSYTIANQSNHEYICYGLMQATNSLYYTLETASLDYPESGGMKTDGLILAFIIVGTSFFVGLWKPAVGIALGSVAFIFCSIIGLIALPSMFIGGAILVAGIVVIFQMRQ